MDAFLVYLRSSWAPLGLPLASRNRIRIRSGFKNLTKKRFWTRLELALPLSGSTWPLFGALGTLPGLISCCLGCLQGSPHTLWNTSSQAFLHNILHAQSPAKIQHTFGATSFAGIPPLGCGGLALASSIRRLISDDCQVLNTCHMISDNLGKVYLSPPSPPASQGRRTTTTYNPPQPL